MGRIYPFEIEKNSSDDRNSRYLLFGSPTGKKWTCKSDATNKKLPEVETNYKPSDKKWNARVTLLERCIR